MKFSETTFPLPSSYDGPLKATLLHYGADEPCGHAVIYLHGYADYFFQVHMAERFTENNYNFYALDLRRNGRSVIEGNHIAYVRDLSEYFEEITLAIETALADGNDKITLLGHSTGGLVAALYCLQGEGRRFVNSLILNSPLFEFNKSWLIRKVFLPMAGIVSKRFPYLHKRNELPSLYFTSLYKGEKGEWDFDTDLKPKKKIPLYFAWTRAVRIGQKKIKRGLRLGIPILVMHSQTSTRPNKWGTLATRTDIVLDVNDIKRYAPLLGNEVTIEAFPGAIHDLVLSRKPVREKVMRKMLEVAIYQIESWI